MDIRDYFLALKRRTFVIIILGVIGFVAGFGVAKTTTPTFSATASVFVSVTSGDSTSELVQGSNYVQNLMQSYAQLATMPVVLEPVIRDLQLESSSTELAKRVTVNAPLNTVLIKIMANAPNASASATLANAIAMELSEQVQQLAPKDQNDKPSVRLDLVAKATTPQVQSAPNTKLIAATGFAAGLFLGVLYAALRAVFDTRLRDEKDLSRVTDGSVLATIPRAKNSFSQAIFRVEPQSSVSDAYRRLAANLQFVSPDKPLTSVLVTSALPAEGKSTVTINLGLALAERGKSVLIIDADLRRPRIAEICGIEDPFGLTHVLTGVAEVTEALTIWGPVDILSAGVIPPNPAELLSSRAICEVIKAAELQYDYVLIDAAPILPVSDTLALTKQVSGTLFVAKANSTRGHIVQEGIQSITSIGAPLAGLVLNQTSARRERLGYGYSATNQATSGVPATPFTLRSTKKHHDVEQQPAAS